MKHILSTLCILSLLLPLGAVERISFKIPVLSVRKNTIGNCSRVDFTFTRTGEKKPLSVGYGENTPAGTGEVIKGSLWLAGITAALQRNTSMSGIEIVIHFKDFTDGPSAGGIICLSILTALDGKTMPADFAMTGTIMPDGTIGLVGGVQYKLKAAGKAGIKRVCIPAGRRFEFDSITKQEVDLNQIARDNGIELHYVKNIQEAYAIMHNLTLPTQDYPSERSVTSLSPEVESAALELFNEGTQIFIDEFSKLTEGKTQQEVENIKKDSLWSLLSIDDSRKYRRTDHFLLAIEAMKLPIAAWGTIGDTAKKLEKIRKRHSGYKKNKNAKIDYFLDLTESVSDTFISKYFRQRMQDRFTDLEQNGLRSSLTQDYYRDRIRPDIPQNDIPAQLEDVNRFSSSVKYVKLFLEKVPTRAELMKLDEKKLDNLISIQENKLFLTVILGRLDTINRIYLKKFANALPEMSANSDVDLIEHLFYATGMAACKMYEVDDLPAVKAFFKQRLTAQLKKEKINKKITDEDVVNFLGNTKGLFLAWQFAKDDSTVMHINKAFTEYKSYHNIAAIKSHILFFTMSHALMVEVNQSNNLPQLIDRARFQAISNILECKKQHIPCIQAVAFFEQAELNRNNSSANRIEDILVNYWNASLMAKALTMSFSKHKNNDSSYTTTVNTPSRTSQVIRKDSSEYKEKQRLLRQAEEHFKKREYGSAFDLLKKADQNDPQVRYLLGLFYYAGEAGVERNIPRAVEHLRYATQSGKVEAYYTLGRALLLVNVSEAIQAFEMGANVGGDVRCQFILGRIYLRGVGVKKNIEKAKMWFKKAADKNYEPAVQAYERLL